jgi:hypothetical protein
VKRALVRLAVLVGAYGLLEWLFAFMTQVEGLVSPKGAPHLGVIALGGAFLALRLLVRGAAPSLAVCAALRARSRSWS